MNIQEEKELKAAAILADAEQERNPSPSNEARCKEFADELKRQLVTGLSTPVPSHLFDTCIEKGS